MTYNIGDRVLLTNEFDEEWMAEEQEYDLDRVVTITQVYNDTHYGTIYKYLNENGLFYEVLDRHIVWKEGVALEDVKEKDKTLQEANPDIVFHKDWVRSIATDIFGENRIILAERNNNSFDLVIHFPEIEITNTVEQKHKIEDLYFRISVLVNRQYFNVAGHNKLQISLSGFRTTYTLKEIEYNYAHSHLHGGVGWQDFCLGSSPIQILLTNLRNSPTEDNWNLFLLSIPNYLSWESLEGGPYYKMGEIKWTNTVSNESIEKYLRKIAKNIPADCIEYRGYMGPIVNDKLIEYFKNNSELRTIDGATNSEERIERRTKELQKTIDGYKCWENKKPIARIHPVEITENSKLSKEVVDNYEKILERKGKEFIKLVEYARAKQQNSEKVFGALGTLQQAETCDNQRTKKENRLVAQTSRE